MPAHFAGPSGTLKGQIGLDLVALGFDQTPISLLVSLIMNVMVLMSTTPRFKLKPIVTWLIFSLSAEITALCAVYNVKDVEFQFDSALVSGIQSGEVEDSLSDGHHRLQDAPAQLINDFFTLGISGAMLSKNPMHWKRSKLTLAETKLLLNFFALVRTLMVNYDAEQLADLVSDYDDKSPLPLPPNHLRHTGVGPRTFNPYRGFQAPTPPPAPTTSRGPIRAYAKSSVRFNPFASRSRPIAVQRATHFGSQLDLNAEEAPGVFSDAPLRMRPRRGFGFGRF
ncbi:hypothetical protein RhiJN_20059 [Ceratobasidium sp. AG-Ba]|nr:hypothetical protein RhiJN_20059 [Ceratobasidium sp. AG-Ba]